MNAPRRPQFPSWRAMVALLLVVLGSGACAISTEEDKPVKVTGVIAYDGWASGSIVVGLFTPAQWNIEFLTPGAGNPFAYQVVAGGKTVSYAIEVDAKVGSIVVGAYNDTSYNLKREAGEPAGYATASVGAGDITVSFTLAAP